MASRTTQGGDYDLSDPVSGFVDVVRRVVLRPAAFFAGLPRQGSFLGPLVFRRNRPRPGAPPPDPNAPPLPPPVPFVWTLPEALRLAEASGPNIGVILDAWHWHHSGGTVADIRAARPERIVHVHVSDAKPMPPEEVQDNMRHLPGEGVIDLLGFFQALKATGFQGGVAPETIGPRIPEGMPPEESARLALEATTAVLKKAGVA